MRSIFGLCGVLMVLLSFTARAVDVIQAQIPISDTRMLDLRVPQTWHVEIANGVGVFDNAVITITADDFPGFTVNIQVIPRSMLGLQTFTPAEVKKQLEIDLASQEQSDSARWQLLEVKGSGGAGYYIRTTGATRIDGDGDDPRTYARGMLVVGDIGVGFDVTLAGVNEALFSDVITLARSAKLSNLARR